MPLPRHGFNPLLATNDTNAARTATVIITPEIASGPNNTDLELLLLLLTGLELVDIFGVIFLINNQHFLLF